MSENLATPSKIDFTAPYALSIDGKLVRTEATFPVYNPATGEVVAQAPEGTADHANAAVAAAGQAFKSWSLLSWDERGAYLERYADALEAHKEELITLLTTEQGKPRHSMATEEVEGSIFWVRETAKRRVGVETLEDDDQRTVEVHRTPLGVVGAITPWNFPVFLALWKVAPALLTGNTMVIKPSPYTPLTTLRFVEIAQGIFPAGVLSAVSGGNELGQVLTEHPGIAKISFTGSTATGRRVMASSAVNLKRLTLELGGNDAAIIMADADWQEHIPTLFWAALGNSGQWCIAPKRLYVHSSIHKDFVKAFTDYASTIKVGNGMDADTGIGPIQNRMQYDKLAELLADTKAKGYKVVLGGELDTSLPGNFVPITVVDNPPEDARIVQEEQFGPIVPIIAFDDIEDVIAKANDTIYGLGGSVWSRDRDAAFEVAKRLETGTVWINEIHYLGVDIPFGGHKQSGMGVEAGRQSFHEYTNSKTYIRHK